MIYYLIHDKILVRGNPDDWLSYEIFKDNHWEHTTHWADKILVDGLSDFKELNEQEALILMNEQP